MALRGRAKTVLVSILVPVVVYLGILNLADRSSWKNPSDNITWQQKLARSARKFIGRYKLRF